MAGGIDRESQYRVMEDCVLLVESTGGDRERERERTRARKREREGRVRVCHSATLRIPLTSKIPREDSAVRVAWISFLPSRFLRVAARVSIGADRADPSTVEGFFVNPRGWCRVSASRYVCVRVHETQWACASPRMSGKDKQKEERGEWTSA